MLSHQVLIPDHSESAPRYASQKAPQGLLRSMNRSAVQLLDCVLNLDANVLDLIRAHARQTAVYCAVDQCSLNQEEILNFLKEAGSNPWPAFSSNMPPKWTLQSYIGLTAVPVSLILNLEGGVHTFHHSIHACRHALEQAKIDLRAGHLKYAIVCATATSQDPLTVKKQLENSGAKKFTGASAAVVLDASSDFTLPASEPDDETYGIADPLVRFLMKEKSRVH